jgi:hypothetical protein
MAPVLQHFSNRIGGITVTRSRLGYYKIEVQSRNRVGVLHTVRTKIHWTSESATRHFENTANWLTNIEVKCCKPDSPVFCNNELAAYSRSEG